jgi:predicted PhzF superfamily epimerase YddE/YHI9
MRMWIVDAFADDDCAGNPAAVVLLDHWPDIRVLQAIAAENNLSETAFLVPNVQSPGRFRLRWFTPVIEVEMCGHATLAAGRVVLQELGIALPFCVFDTASGPIVVARADDAPDSFTLDLPSRPRRPYAPHPELGESLDVRIVDSFQARYATIVLATAEEVETMVPNASIDRLVHGPEAGMLTVTAPADEGSGFDFVCRFFAPSVGVLEDPVTGSALADLAPYWCARLDRERVRGLQVSPRGGTSWCEPSAATVALTGQAVLFSRAEIVVPLDQLLARRRPALARRRLLELPPVAGYEPAAAHAEPHDHDRQDEPQVLPAIALPAPAGAAFDGGEAAVGVPDALVWPPPLATEHDSAPAPMPPEPAPEPSPEPLPEQLNGTGPHQADEAIRVSELTGAPAPVEEIERVDVSMPAPGTPERAPDSDPSGATAEVANPAPDADPEAPRTFGMSASTRLSGEPKGYFHD